MSKEQALAILDRAASMAPMSRIDHQAVIQALEVIKSLLEKSK